MPFLESLEPQEVLLWLSVLVEVQSQALRVLLLGSSEGELDHALVEAHWREETGR